MVHLCLSCDKYDKSTSAPLRKAPHSIVKENFRPILTLPLPLSYHSTYHLPYVPIFLSSQDHAFRRFLPPRKDDWQFRGFIQHRPKQPSCCKVALMHVVEKHTPPKFNSSPLKNAGWKTILSYWVSVTFQGRAVKLLGGSP